MIITETTALGAQLKQARWAEILQGIDEIKEERNYEDDKNPLDDYCVFIRRSGYMLLNKKAYAKLSKKDKKMISKSYDYKQIPAI